MTSVALASSTGGAGKETPIIAVTPGIGVESFDAGSVPGSGTYFCALCSSQLSLRENDQLPECPRCGASEFHRDSIFEPMQEHGQTAELAIPATELPPKWLPEARAMLPRAGRYIACREDGEIRIFTISQGWTRIGRSSAADIRLDDPSVSRRHALIVSELPDSLRILDDRSLNGVFVNGEIVEWGRLEDGDELAIGRFRLFALER
jgi:FHA domain/Zinc-ribbon containing domain